MQWKHYKGMTDFLITDLKVLENTMAVLAIVTFNHLQGLKIRINCHKDDLDELDRSFMSFLAKPMTG